MDMDLLRNVASTVQHNVEITEFISSRPRSRPTSSLFSERMQMRASRAM